MLRAQSANTAGSTFTLAFAAIVVRGATRVFRALKNRIEVTRLCEFDERTLKDIGLTHSDVRAALALPLASDPSAHLRDVAGHKRSPERGSHGQALVVSRLRASDAPVTAASPSCPV